MKSNLDNVPYTVKLQISRAKSRARREARGPISPHLLRHYSVLSNLIFKPSIEVLIRVLEKASYRVSLALQDFRADDLFSDWYKLSIHV